MFSAGLGSPFWGRGHSFFLSSGEGSSRRPCPNPHSCDCAKSRAEFAPIVFPFSVAEHDAEPQGGGVVTPCTPVRARHTFALREHRDAAWGRPILSGLC